MLVRFMAKRVAVMAVLATAAALVLGGLSPWTPVGIWLGAFLGVYRMRTSSRVLAEHASGVGRAVFAQVALLAVSLGALVLSALVNVRLFAGISVGLLLAPLFICVNALTESIGLTHNAWGG